MKKIAEKSLFCLIFLYSCVHEYMDVYSEVLQPDPAELVNTPFGGRYCGPIPPRARVSLYRALALSYHTDKNVSTSDIFLGRYQFINDSEYEIGTPLPGGPCNFLVKGNAKPTGVILTPTYPGAYPKALHCSYQFLGSPGQRIRLEFRDFDLFFGGPHCPFDFVKVYDGPDNTSAVIGTYCGQQRNLVIYSSESSLLVTFATLPRTANTQNRGFKGIFEFSNSFTKLAKKNRLGLCLVRTIRFPICQKLVCRYFIYGMQDSQHLERVRLEFVLFEIPKGSKGDCSDGYLKIYLRGQETTDSYDKFDYEMCGSEAKPAVVASDGPRLVMVFSSGELMGRGFKANYTFETGVLVKKKGDFNSPRYPANYPSETNCTYLFLATNNEQVSLVFDNFKIRADSVNTSIGSYGTTICQEDWIDIFNVYRDGIETMIGRYCHMSAPGPIESNRGAMGLKVILHSDSDGVYSGFKARYSFEKAKSIFGDCGGNVSSLDHGVLSSPNYPKNYDAPSKNQASKSCNWYVNVRPKYKILMIFEKIAIEGDPINRGCAAAVLRLWYDLSTTPVEMCGETPITEKWQYLSTSNAIRFSFITADKAVGAPGFKAVWTEVIEGPGCDEFQCLKTGFCIPDRLRCNKESNCGADDNSDEADCE
ncbi:hypothetical protein NQ317_009805 [Molorchus minor]|uniref:CUB domain-containing protein n=1 Tax=Molorchus minor TaxID=1323400 RepID=A0ABQ9JTC0_9CUCU|nr:hypothetical protein NQ317_009805 [Molorchus minor]